MVTVNDLDIRGEQIAELGYHSSQIGEAKKTLVKQIHQQALHNKNPELQKYLEKNGL